MSIMKMDYAVKSRSFARFSSGEAIDATLKCLHYNEIANRMEHDISLTDFEERQQLQGSLAYLRETARKLNMPEASDLADRIEKLFRGVKK